MVPCTQDVMSLPQDGLMTSPGRLDAYDHDQPHWALSTDSIYDEDMACFDGFGHLLHVSRQLLTASPTPRHSPSNSALFCRIYLFLVIYAISGTEACTLMTSSDEGL